MGFNANQKKAIDEPLGKNILVSAAAGSGKTRVLVERIVSLLGKKVPDSNMTVSLANMVIMTFTKKATSEMKKKIKDRIDEKIKEGNVDKELFIKESAILQSANISTIDSFCKKILEENYDKLSDKNSVYGTFEPAYRIADEKELDILYNDVLDDLLEKKYMNEKYALLFNTYIEKGDDAYFKKMLLAGIRFMSSIPWPDEEISNKLKNFEKISHDIKEEYINKRIEKIKNECADWKKIFDEMYAILYESKFNLEKEKKERKNTYKNVINLIESILPKIEALLITINKFANNASDIKEKCELFDKIGDRPNFPRGDFAKVPDKDIYAEYKEKIIGLYYTLSDVSEIYEMVTLPDDIVYNKNEKLFLELLLDFYYAIVKEKKTKSIYAISDYANLSLDILYDRVVKNDGTIERVPSSIAHNLADKYSTIFIDEYQDTNYIQENILSAITNNFMKKNVFMVGDIKQSIYGFRNAEPAIFNAKYREYEMNDDDNKLITLNSNYRSRNTILHYVNDLFCNIMHEEFGGVDYKNKGMLGEAEIDKNDTEYKESPIIDSDKVEIDLIAKDEDLETENQNIDNSDDESDDDLDNLVYEAEFVAKKIKELVDSGKCTYKEVVILLRSTKGKAEYFLDALSKYGIPAYSELNKGFFNRFEIKLMFSLLRIIDNPLQNVEITNVLTSPIFDIKNSELAILGLIYKEAIDFGKKESLVIYDAIGYFISKYDTLKTKYSCYDVDLSKLKVKLEKFDSFLKDLTFKSRYLSISELINTIYESTNIKDIVLSMVDGKMRKANLDILYQNARGYESSSYVGLFNFLRYVEKILSREDDQGQAKLLGENDNVVRIMTIHTSKGLEFPVVFLSNACKKYNEQDAKDNYFYDKKYGIALYYVDPVKRYKYATPKIKYAKEKCIDKNRMEEMRMLYVALTRAKSKLYVTSFIKTSKNSKAATFNTACYEALNDFIMTGITKKYEYDVSKIRKVNNYLSFMTDYYPIGKEFVSINLTKLPSRIDMTPIIIKSNKKIKKSEIKFNYKYDFLRRIDPKFSVSDIKSISKETNGDKEKAISNQSMYYDDVSIIDDQIKNLTRLDGTSLGTAYHRFMQFYDYDKNEYNCPYENNERESCVTQVKKEKISAFLDSTVGKKMATAFKNNMLYREHKFMKLFSRNEINEYIHDDTIKCDEKNVIIQGIVDAFFIEKDENYNDYIVLVDYKTDRITKTNINKEEFKKYLINNYKVQLDIYGRVLHELTGLDVREKYIYSFAIDEAVKI